MRQPTPMVWPKRGLNETLALTEQNAEFSRDEKNARTQDPTDKRMRGAQRSGTTKLIAGSSGAGKVQDLGVVTRAQRAITYAEVEATDPFGGADVILDERKFEEQTPSSEECRDIDTDDQGNAYALDGNSGWVKYSASGTRIVTVPVSLVDKKGVLRSIHVDQLRNVYVSVGEGGVQGAARIWAWRPELDEEGNLEYVLRWTINPEAFVGDIFVRDRMLYAALNDEINGRSAVAVYELIHTARPQLERIFDTQHPLRGIVTQTSGSVVVCSPANPDRLSSKVTAGGQQRLFGTPLEDLEDNGDIKIWSEFRADSIVADDLILGTDSQPRVSSWRDVSRNGIARDFFTNSTEGVAPLYEVNGPLNGTPAVYFDGDAILSSRQNPSVKKANAASQRSAIPSYEDAQFCVFMVLTPISEGVNGCLLSQAQQNTLGKTDGQVRPFGIHTNRKESDLTSSVSTDIDFVSVRDESVTDLWAGIGANPLAMDFANQSHAAATASDVISPQAGVLTFFCDGNLNKGAGNVRSLFRWNGVPIDRATSRPLESLEACHLGKDPNNLNLGFFKGWVHRIVVVDRMDLTDDTLGCFSDHKTGSAYQYPDIAYAGASDTIMEKIEAILAREHGLGGILDPGSSMYSLGNGGADSTYIHPYGDGVGALHISEVPWDGTAAADPNQFRTVDPFVTKYDAATNNVVWILPDGVSSYLGHGLALHPEEFSLGGQNMSSVGVDGAVKIQDAGLTVSMTVTAPFQATGAHSDEYCRIAVDSEQFTYVPYITTGSFANGHSVMVMAPGGGLTLGYRTGALIASSRPCYAVAVPHSHPEYALDLAGVGDRSEYMYVGSAVESFDALTDGYPAVMRVDLITASHNTNVPRITELLCVNSGDIKKADFGGGVWTAAVNGTGALDAAATFVTATTLFGKRYFTDGMSYALYDPLEGTLGSVIEWKASQGTIPPRRRVIENYRGRIVMFGDPDSGHNWEMSAKDEPNNWDFAPPQRTPSQAINGNSPDLTGRIPSVITCFAPITDDVAIIGTDSSIFLLRGDPLANGQIDLISRQYGIAFGKAWAQDPDGRVYVMLTTGDVVQIAGEGGAGYGVVNLSENAIESRLEQIDLSTHYVEMVWDQRENGLRVMVMPFAASSSPNKPEHYFYEMRTRAWHPDTFTAQGHQPTSVSQMDGDSPDDLRVIYGAEDGFVRVFDQAALSDDGERIDFYVVAGPIFPESAADSRFRFSGFDILLSSSHQGGQFGLCGTDDPARLDFVYHLIDAGRTRLTARMAGAYCFWRIGNNHIGQRLAFEEGSYRWSRAGRKRANA